MKILLTGFAPFGGQKINPSWEACKAIEEEGIVRCCLPVEWDAAGKQLLAEIDKHAPDLVFLTGQAGGRAAVSVERLGVNIADCAAPDNAGVVRENMPICADAPDAFAATWPYEAVLNAIRAENIPVAYSYDAGRYICNYVLYTALWASWQRGGAFRAGFLHLPFLPGQKDGAPCLAMEDQIRAVRAALRACREENT